MSIIEQWGWNWSNWYKGNRGEYWLLAQVFGLFAFALLPIQRIMDTTALVIPIQIGIIAISEFLGAIALFFIGKGLFDLGHSLTPLPYPREDGELVTKGVYSIVRHPLYSGIILAAFAWALFTLSWPQFLGLLPLVWLLDRKATLEEQWLAEKYPTYDRYRINTKKLIPWIW
jgi:protein-S-isoprenylcysteine O-methyltransferase Ste14